MDHIASAAPDASRSARLLALAVAAVLAAAGAPSGASAQSAETEVTVPAPQGCTGLVASAGADSYRTGESVVAILDNCLDEPAYLPGCNHVTLEVEAVPGTWEERVYLNCFWEGYAVMVPAQTRVTYGFDFLVADEPGTWRVRFDVSLGCLEGKPLSTAQCRETTTVVSSTFTVR